MSTCISEETKDISLQPAENDGHSDGCAVCGCSGPSERLSRPLVNLLVKTGTISSDCGQTEAYVCDSCSSSVTLMESACHAQIALSERFHQRNKNGVNGLKASSFTEQLLTPGHDVNMPGGLNNGVLSEDAEPGELIISQVEGQVDSALLVSSECYTAHTTSSPSDVLAADSDGDDSNIHSQAPQHADEHDTADDEKVSQQDSVSLSPSSQDISNDEKVSTSTVWNCRMCDLVYDTSRQLVSHIKSSHHKLQQGEKALCPFCSLQFSSSTGLFIHISRTHRDGRNGCEGCSSFFRKPGHLISHQIYCARYHRYLQTCKSTKTELVQSKERCKEKSRNGPYYCVGCSTAFELLKDLFVHQRACHMMERLEHVDDSNCSLRLSCHGCQAVSDSYSSLAVHESSCQLVQSLLNEEAKVLHQSVDGVGREPSATNLVGCPHQIGSSKGAKLNSMNVHEKVRNHKVDSEGRSGGLDDDKASAMSENSSDGFKCPQCYITMEFKTLLDFHMSIHENVEKYAFHCVGCNAGFDILDRKLSHEEKCGKCKFVNNISEESDIRGRTSGTTNVFQCKACHSQFKFFNEFEAHKKSCKSEETAGISSTGCNSAKLKTRASLASVNSGSSTPSTADLLAMLDYTAPEIFCPLCGVDIKSPCEKTVSGAKSKAVRHFAGHEPSSKHVFICPGCSWGTSYPGRLAFVKHTNMCRKLAKKFPEVTFDEKNVNCPICLIKFPSYNACSEHLKNHLETAGQFVCEGCRISLGDAAQLENHHSRCLLFPRAMLARRSGGFGCSVCSTSYVHGSRGLTHFLDLHTVSMEKIWCVFCNTPFVSLHDLIVHVNTKCGMAKSIIWENGKQSPNSLRTSDEIAVPLSNVTTDVDTDSLELSDQESFLSECPKKSKFVCHICGAATTSKDRLNNHFVIHTESHARHFHCSQCNAGFKTLGILQRHEAACLKRNFSGRSQGKSSDSAVVSDNEMNGLHVESLTTVEPTDIEIEVRQERGKNVFECSVCNQEYSGEDQLVQHTLLEHSTSEYCCHGCGKMFKHEESILEHRLHCGKYSRDASDEVFEDRQRKAISTNEDEVAEWKCLSCCVRFSSEMSFLLHVASHEVVNVSRCSLCFISLKSAADICMHMVKHHKEYLVTGVKEGLDDSDKDSDEDSDVEMTADGSNANETAPVKPASQPVGDSSKLSSRPKSPISNEVVPVKCKQPASLIKNAADFNHDSLTGTQCPVCSRQFSSNAILRRHYGIHDGYYPAVCHTCGIGFWKHVSLRDHKRNVHRTPKATDLTCDRCGGAFDQSYRLKKHMELCICPRSDSVIQCLLCVRTFDSWQQFKNHYWSHLTKCSYCEEKITTQSRRVDHMINCSKSPLNGGKASYMVSADGQLPTPSTAVTPHKPKPKTTTSGPFRCKQCCSVQMTLAKLRNHEKTHVQAEYRCRLCGGKFNTLLAKNRHIMKDHKASEKCANSQPPKVEEVEVKPPTPPDDCEIQTFYTCNVCNECFKNKEEKEKHVAKMHPVDEVPAIRTFDCKQCDKKFPSKFARRRHMQTAHSSISSKTNSLACPLCSKPCGSNFAKMQHMKKVHQLTETPKKKRVCRLCGECFDHKSELKAHRRAQHPQAYVDNCIDLDPNMVHVSNALASATPSKVRRCKFCNQLFRDKSLLKDHVATQHGQHSSLSDTGAGIDQPDEMAVATLAGLPPQVNGGPVAKVRVCKECGQTFDSKSELKAHKRAVHSRPVDASNGFINQAATSQKRSLEISFDASTVSDEKRQKSEDSIVETTLSGNTPDGGKFKCEHCPKYFKLRVLLNKHHTKAHPWIP